MSITAKLSDGTLLKFPDGTDQAVIQRTVKNHMSTTPPATAAQPTPQPPAPAVPPNVTAQPPNAVPSDITQGGAMDGAGRLIAESLGPDMQRSLQANPMISQINANAGKPQPASEVAKDGVRYIYDPLTQDYRTPADMARTMHPSQFEALRAGAANGLTFGWGDELIGATKGPFEAAQAQAFLDASKRDYPKTALTGAIAGGAAATLPAAYALPEMAAASMVERVASGVGTGMGLGAIFGGVQGAGEAPAGAKVEGLVNGAALGTAFGGILGGAAPWLGASASKLWQWMRTTDVSAIASKLNIGTDAAKIIKAHVSQDDFPAAAKALAAAGPKAMLADAGPGASQLLDTTMQSGGGALTVGREAVHSRASAAMTTLNGVMDRAMGAVEGVKGLAVNIAKRTATMRQNAYDRAYAAPIDYSTGGAGEQILGILSKMPSNLVNQAIEKANIRMKWEGTPNNQIMASVAPDGSVSFSKLPNVEQLDFIKRAVGDIAAEAKDIHGRPTSDGLVYSSMAKSLRDAVVKAAPAYQTALKLGGDKIQEDAALTMGQKLLTEDVTREDAAAFFSGASVEAKLAAKRGLRSAIDEGLANVKTTIANTGTDIGEAVKLVKDLSSRANIKKVTILLGKAQADTLMKALDTAGVQLALRGAVARNSATAVRMAGQKTMDAIINDGPINALKDMKPVEAVRRVVQIMTKRTEADKVQYMQKVYKEIATALTQIRGPQAQAALKVVQDAISGQPIKNAQATLVGKALAGAVVLPAYQLGMRHQSPR